MYSYYRCRERLFPEEVHVRDRIYTVEQRQYCRLPLLLERVAAGFPSPAEDYLDNRLDLHELLIRHPAATYYVRAGGDSMTGAGIFAGDILIVDRSLEPRHGDIAVAVLNGGMTVKRLELQNGCCRLCPENSNYPPLKVGPEDQFEIWGVVTCVLHRTR